MLHFSIVPIASVFKKKTRKNKDLSVRWERVKNMTNWKNKKLWWPSNCDGLDAEKEKQSQVFTLVPSFYYFLHGLQVLPLTILGQKRELDHVLVFWASVKYLGHSTFLFCTIALFKWWRAAWPFVWELAESRLLRHGSAEGETMTL